MVVPEFRSAENPTFSTESAKSSRSRRLKTQTSFSFVLSHVNVKPPQQRLRVGRDYLCLLDQPIDEQSYLRDIATLNDQPATAGIDMNMMLSAVSPHMSYQCLVSVKMDSWCGFNCEDQLWLLWSVLHQRTRSAKLAA